MINGEETPEAVSEVAFVIDPFSSSEQWRDEKTDEVDPVSPASSRYSSCGESEFERYCSANSAMGTPSMCSTITVFHDFHDSEYGSLKNLGYLDDSGLDNFSLEGSGKSQSNEKFLSNGDNELQKGILAGNSRVNYGSSGMELYDKGELSMLEFDQVNHGGLDEILSWKVENDLGLVGDLVFDDDSDKGDADDSRRDGFVEGRPRSVSGVVGNGTGKGKGKEICEINSLEGVGDGNSIFEERIEGAGPCKVSTITSSDFTELNLQSHLQYHERGKDIEDEDDTSSMYAHSRGEGSLYNCFSDDECKNDVFSSKYIHYQLETKFGDENPLLINTSVAFGTDDWNDFMCETAGNALHSLTSDMMHKKRENLKSSYVAVIGSPSIKQTNKGENPREMHLTSKNRGGELINVDSNHQVSETEGNTSSPWASDTGHKKQENLKSSYVDVIGSPSIEQTNKGENAREMHLTSKNGGGELINVDSNHQVSETEGNTSPPWASDTGHKKQENLKSSYVDVIGSPSIEQTNKGENVREMHLTSKNSGRELNNVDNDHQVSGNQGPVIVKVKVDPLSDIVIIDKFSSSVESLGDKFLEDHECNPQQSTVESKFEKISPNLFEDHIPSIETQNLGQNELYDDVVNEMEEILLDSTESPRSRFSYGSKMFQSQMSLPFRDGRLTASTSSINDTNLLIPSTSKIDEIEVVGARQKRGDVSFSERLVGVKEYTVYRIRVWSGADQWEVEHRYRDFYSLYTRLKSYFADHGWTLPSPWLSVERESIKIFGNATPDVIAERSAIIQECLRSVLHSKLHSTLPNALIWFLSPEESSSGSSLIERREDIQSFHTLGKMVSLIVEIQPYKSIKQMLEAQHYVCAGCRRFFDDGKTSMQGFVQKFGWGKPRLCEYTGQLFCSSCHTNDVAVIPAKVLHHWDFYRYPVSQLAKSYLDSIHEQPMLCLSAVNPFLFSKVPALFYVMGIRKKIRSMLPYVRCPFRNSINIGLGNRRYLLESNDFFALRDLIDLSKGAFAAFPVMVETVSRKILEHIMEQCLICCDVGIPCGARQACSDPSALIFPFQEDEVEKCKSCELVFHKPCFGKLINCPCGAHLRNHGKETRANENGSLGPKSNSPLGFLSGLFTKSTPENIEPPDRDHLILMDTLPSTIL